MFFCSKCNKKYRRFRYICDCGGVLIVHYKKYKWRLDKKANGIWKYRFLLPRTRKRITLDEGNTPVDSAGTFEVQETISGNVEHSFEFTMMFENLTQYNLFLGSTTPQEQPTATGLEVNANNGVVKILKK